MHIFAAVGSFTSSAVGNQVDGLPPASSRASLNGMFEGAFANSVYKPAGPNDITGQSDLARIFAERNVTFFPPKSGNLK